MNPKKRVLFSTGMSADVTPGVPVRILAYLMPLLSAMQSRENTRGQFYFADRAQMRLGEDPAIIEDNVQLVSEYIRQFIKAFYAKTEGDVLISREREDSAERRQLVQELVDTLIQENNRAIITFAEKRIKEGQTIRNPLAYMAEHALFMREPVTDDENLFLIDNPPDFDLDALAMVGGPAEEIFFNVRKIIGASRGDIQKTYDRIQLFGKIGNRPPYFKCFGEPVIESGIDEPDVKTFLEKVSPELFKDFLYLLTALSDSKDYTIIERRKCFGEKDFASLKSGFDTLQSFIKQL